ncbi:flagellar motor protein MotD [Desulfoplanes formicivorans]|uniref:Flagellar motor protein MotD n=2 Tax=Desulfoplanes formicivorans TaxID=1592317 RepID=A0A194AI85_9BACT|nr:flagellar motor protein MotD [Desulfoplanes formicivorans]
MAGLLDQSPDQGSDPGSWSVPWSDLMMTMFILFAVLFVYASAKRDFFREVSEALTGSTQDVRQELDRPESRVAKVRPVHRDISAGVEAKTAPSLRLGDEEQSQDTPDRKAFSLEKPLLFDHLSDKLEPEALSLLQSMLPVLQQSHLDVEVIGYTDGMPVHTPTFAGNWELAIARAMSVAHWLMHEGGIAPSRITVSSRGANDPRVPNTSRANRIHNRRVEIFLTRNRQGT